jgi:Domain of unknown function (DUF5069)
LLIWIRKDCRPKWPILGIILRSRQDYANARSEYRKQYDYPQNPVNAETVTVAATDAPGAARTDLSHLHFQIPRSYFWSRIQPHEQRRTNMSTPIVDRDLTKQPPHSPRDRLADFAIAKRTIDKCRASLKGTLGEFHYDCPLDNMLFGFKQINGDQFKAVVKAAKAYDEVGDWLLKNRAKKSPEEIKAWSDNVEASSLYNNPEKKDYFSQSCAALGLNPEKTTTFQWLEADDRASFSAGKVN